MALKWHFPSSEHLECRWDRSLSSKTWRVCGGTPGGIRTHDPRFRKGFQPWRCSAPKQWFRGSLRPIEAFRKTAQAVSSRRTQRHQDACTEAMACTVHACLVRHFGVVEWEPLRPSIAQPAARSLDSRGSPSPGRRGRAEGLPHREHSTGPESARAPRSARRPAPSWHPQARGLDSPPSCSPFDP